MNFEKIIKQINNSLIDSKKIIITTHRNPDGDAIGSSMALYHLAKQLGKKVSILISGNVPQNLLFLDENHIITPYNKEVHFQTFLMADTLFALDFNDQRRLHIIEEAFKNSNAKKILIDHHENPFNFTKIMYSDSDASSTGEMIYRLVKSFDESMLTKDIADALYVAIMTDSGNFRFPRTDAELHRIIADLIDSGADPVMLYEKTYNQNRISAVHILGYALKSITLHFNGKLSLMTITSEMLEQSGATNDDLENFAEKTLQIEGVEVGLLLANIENTDEIRISLRSKGNISVGEIAKKIGGGGHKNAAGARGFNMTIDQVKNQLLPIIERFLYSQ